jgi:hypothetical protein
MPSALGESGLEGLAVRGLPPDVLDVLGPGVIFADADQYQCAVERRRPGQEHPLDRLNFQAVSQAPWLMRAWKYDYGGSMNTPATRSRFPPFDHVDRKGVVTVGEWQLAEGARPGGKRHAGRLGASPRAVRVG